MRRAPNPLVTLYLAALMPLLMAWSWGCAAPTEEPPSTQDEAQAQDEGAPPPPSPRTRTARPAAPLAPADSPGPAEQPPHRPGWYEVLDVEVVDGRPVAIMIDAGPESVSVCQQGELWGAEASWKAPLGLIEIVRVHAGGARARVIGELQGPIEFDTMAFFRRTAPLGEVPDPDVLDSDTSLAGCGR